jgi:hypothetical protein
MANIVCDFETPCLQPDYTNLSAEAPDQNFFWGFNWGDPQNDPPLNSEWQDWSCLGVCESTVSQAAADQCAAVAQAECLLNGGPPLGTSPTNGNPPANYPGRHPASPNPASIPPFSGLCCVGVPFPPFQLKATAFKTPFLFEMVAGELPPGMVMVNGTLSGTPTQAGMFYFTVQVTDRTGATATQDMTFEALGFSTAPTGVPDATIGTAYNFSFETGNLQGVLFYLTGGSLPTGLTLNNNGTITGTPSGTPGSTLFTVTIRDAALNECSQDFVIAVQASGGGGGGIGAWTFVSSLNEGGSQNNNSGNIITFAGGVWNSTMSAPFPFLWTSGVCQIILTNTSATNRTFVVSAVASVTNWNCDAVANAQILINPANLDPATVYSGGLSGSVSFLVGANSTYTVTVAVDFGAFFSTAVAGATGTITLSAA